MKIAIASDHAGFAYKQLIREHLLALGHEVKDFGTDSDESCDYPKFIRPAALAVAEGLCERGIVLGGSGNGEAMVANRVRGIRCALCWDVRSAELARQHNDANVLSLGQRMVSSDLALRLVDIFLKEPFEGGRHLRRIRQIDEQQVPRVFVLEATDLVEIKGRVPVEMSLRPAMERLTREADEALKAGPFSVMDKDAVPPSGDKHDYMSYGPYWWPNPDTSDGLPYIRRDGQVNPHGEGLDRQAHGRLRTAVQTLALAYFLTERDDYAAHAARLLRAWYLDPTTAMNPHLEYGQAVPGVCTGRGIGIIDTAGDVALLDAVGLLGVSKHWTEADLARLQDWYRRYLDWMLISDYGKDEFRQPNNHGTWYDAQAACYALFTDQPALAHRILVTVPEMRLATQIEPDGRQPAELRRTRSLTYSAFNLHALFNLAAFGWHVGMDLWNYQTPDGRGIRKALDWLLPYAMAPSTWPHPQITDPPSELLCELLRIAAAEYGDEHYKTAFRHCCPPGCDSRMHLLYPPII